MGPLGEMEDPAASPGSPSHPPAMEDVVALHTRLAQLEEDNSSLRASCTHLQHKLDQVQETSAAGVPGGVEKQDSSSPDTKCSRCDLLTEEINASRGECQELRRLQQALESQVVALQAQVDESLLRENQLKVEVKALEEAAASTEHRFPKIESEPSDLPSVHSLALEEAAASTEHRLTKIESEPSDLPSVPSLAQQEAACLLDSRVSPDTLPVATLTDQKQSQDAADNMGRPQETLDECRRKLEDIEKENMTLKEQCRVSEIEKTTLRTNIRKVSANWFERKTRLSDSESESPQPNENSGSRKEESVQVPDPAVIERFGSLFKKIEDMPKLLAEISFIAGKLDLTERMCCELRKRVQDYESVIDDQEIIIHGLKDQLDTYFNDNQKMSQQLSNLTKLFEDLELTEKTRVSAVNPPDTSSSSFPSLPSEDDFKQMSSSVSMTYIKLKELILEKKSLVTEIERLQVLNIELQRRVTQQETRLVNVSDALHTTWLLVSDMKEQHAQLHSSESILRYELKEKRELLHRLREELECSREQWHKIRQMNSQSEEAWNTLRDELNERRRLASEAAANGNTGEGGQEEETQGAVATVTTSEEFEPPVDLLLDMAIEYGVIDADDDTSTALVAALEGQDLRGNRLQDLEDQCSYLYQKLMASTARSLTLASRLSALHHHFGSSDEDDDDDDDEDEYDEEYDEEHEEMEEHDHLHQLESELLSPDTESSDTAYMSEADTGSAASGAPSNLSEEEAAGESLSPSEEPIDVDGDLSKRLINFLPRKIEILHRENRRLEERCELLHHEKLTTESQLGQALQGERQLKRQLEEQLEHLGKCVDELKLERNGKIIEAEERLKQKVESLSQRKQEYESLQEEIERLQEKYEERGNLLHVANDRVKQLESALQTREATGQDTATQLHQANVQVRELQSVHEELNSEYGQLKEEMINLQQQLADLKFQVSSKDMERHAAIQADQEKMEALTAAISQISQHEEQISNLKQQLASKKQEVLSQQGKHTSEVEQVTQTLEERESRCSSLDQQLQQTESTLKVTQESLFETQSDLSSTRKESTQLTQDNEQLREKIIQLLCRRVRVCDDCFSVQAELAAIVAFPPPLTTTTHQTERGDGAGSSMATSTSGPLPISTAQPDDDEYAVISDDELQSSKMSSSPSSDSPPSSSGLTETRATLDILTLATLTATPLTNAEVWVGAGTRVLVPVELPAGVSLCWNFVSEPKSVSFAVLHQPPAESPSQQEKEEAEEGSSAASQQRVLIPTTRVASAQGSTIRGKLLSKQPGVYTLVFDNSCSRFIAKKVTYSLRLEKPASKEASPPQPSTSLPVS